MEGLLLLLALLLLLVLVLVVVLLTFLGEGRMRKWGPRGIYGSLFGFSAVLGEGPLGPLSVFMRSCIQQYKINV